MGRVKHILGQLYASVEVFKQGFAALERWQAGGPGSRVVNTGERHLSMAGLLYEWNRLDEAEALVGAAQRLNELSRFPPLLASELELALLLRLARGEVEAARALLGQLDRLRARVHPANLFHKRVVDVMAMNGTLAVAAQAPDREPLLAEVAGWVRAHKLEAEDPFEYPREGGYQVLARLLLAQDRPAEAFSLLERLTRAAQTGGRNDDLIRYLLLRALAAQALGHEQRALGTLRRALDLAQPEGYLRSFVALGVPLQTLLKTLAVDHDTPYIAKLLEAFSGSAEPTSQPASGTELLFTPAVPIVPEPLEPLSERERAVLRLLVAGNSNKEIARTLELSPYTVRWYVSGLLGKLHVSTRLEAVSRARDLGLR